MAASVLRLILTAATLSFILSAQSNSAGEWLTYGGNKGFSRYSPLDQINRDNVNKLGIVWGRPAVDPQIKDKFPDLSPSNYFRGTPIMGERRPLRSRWSWAGGSLRCRYRKNQVGSAARGADVERGRGRKHAWRRLLAQRFRRAHRFHTRAVSVCFGRQDWRAGARVWRNGRISLKRETSDNAPYFGWPGPFIVNDVIVVGGNGGGRAAGGYGDGGFDAGAKPEDLRGYDIAQWRAALDIPRYASKRRAWV